MQLSIQIILIKNIRLEDNFKGENWACLKNYLSKMQIEAT